MARPSKFTPETQERICQLLRAGNTHGVAAEASGISLASFYKWRREHSGFRDAVERAEAEAEAMLVARIQKAAAAGSWRAASWLLERRAPERWAPARERSGADEQPRPDVATLYDVANPTRARRATPQTND